LTGSVNRHGNPVYRCYRAQVVPDHPKRYRVLESTLLPALMAEAAHLRLPEAVESEGGDDALRASLAAKRARIVDLYADGVIDKAERSRRLELVADAEAAVSAAKTVRELPDAVDWTWPPTELNTVLRALWSRVRLGPDMTPVAFEWNVPEWRG
jgi:hypothetical protein